MARLSISLGMWALIGWMGSGAESVTAAGNQETLLGTAVPQRLRALCGACHCDGADEGGIAFDGLLERACAAGADSPGRQGGADHDAWLAIWKNLRAGVMPPADELQPSATERALVLGLIEREIFGLDPARPDPGRVVLRRLNRVEYANTIRDLVGLDINVVDNLPTDDTGFGFDTIADVLTLSPLVVEKYLETATAVAKQIVSKVQAPQRGGAYSADVRLVFLNQPVPLNDAARQQTRNIILKTFASRAFRRPVDPISLQSLIELSVAAEGIPGGTFEQGIGAGLTAVLAAPRFIFRVEADAEKVSRLLPSGQPVAAIDEHALAARLSYFLWSSMPDEELLTLANAGQLRADLAKQVDRMIDDERCDALAKNFVGQWLQTRDVESLPFDVRTILGVDDRQKGEKIFSEDVRHAMRLETEMLFLHLLRANLPATDLLVGKATFLNAALAKFYGIPGVEGKKMRLVKLDPESHRGGLLTHGSFLTVTSNPSRTSPVKRGLFILDNLLGTPARPAPADVPSLETAAAQVLKNATMRDLMTQHRHDALCASCHARMDPLGLALEPYNAVGQWREAADSAPLETGGRLITGESFANVRELSACIVDQRRPDFYRCLSEKILTYALGRGVEYYDATVVDKIVADLLEADGLRTLVQSVVASDAFQLRRQGFANSSKTDQKELAP